MDRVVLSRHDPIDEVANRHDSANPLPIHDRQVPAAGGETFVNGSLIGGNEFSIGALGKCDKPSQWLFTVHPEHGVASRWPIYGDGTNQIEPYQLEPWPRRISA